MAEMVSVAGSLHHRGVPLRHPGGVVQTISPTERSVMRGLAVLRWGSLAWIVGVVAISRDRLERPWLAYVLVAAATAVTVVASVALARRPLLLVRPAFVSVELVVGVALLVGDGFAFDDLADRQSLAGSWPLVGVLHASVLLGPIAGGILGAVVSLGRVGGMLADGWPDLPGHRIVSLLATSVFYALAGAVAGWVAALLRRAEHEVAVTRAREEVARTLHDGVLQTLALVERRVATADPELARLARDTDRDLRGFLFGAHRSTHGDVASELRAVADRVGAAHDLPITVSVVDDDLALSGDELRALAGAVGEALTNVGKHAHAARAVVFVQSEEDGSVFVSVRDDGVGFAPADAHARGQGLRRSIIARIEERGGRVEIDAAPGRGTEVRMWM
jgi:signal transduction histidine kinase